MAVPAIFAVRKIVYQAMAGSTALRDVVQDNIFDRATPFEFDESSSGESATAGEGVRFPCVTIGDTEERENLQICDGGLDFIQIIHVWDLSDSMADVAQAAREIRLLFKNKTRLSMDGTDISMTQFRSARYARETAQGLPDIVHATIELAITAIEDE